MLLCFVSCLCVSVSCVLLQRGRWMSVQGVSDVVVVLRRECRAPLRKKKRTAAQEDSISLRKLRTSLANRGFAPLGFGTRNSRVVSAAFKGMDMFRWTRSTSRCLLFDFAEETTYCAANRGFVPLSFGTRNLRVSARNARS